MLSIQNSLSHYTRVRLRLPEGMLNQYKQWATHAPNLAVRRGIRQRILLETALCETMRRLESGEVLTEFEHRLRTNSLLLDTVLLRQLNIFSKQHGVKCGHFIRVALTDYLYRMAKERYDQLRVGHSGKVHGARLW